MSVFNKDFQPHQLDPVGFKDFALHVMQGLYVDETQPYKWSRIARADGSGISLVRLGREIAPKVDALGGALSPNLLNKIIRVFRFYGPVLDEALSYRATHPREEVAA